MDTFVAASSQIPYHYPYAGPRAGDYLNEALASGKSAGNGPFGKRCCHWLKEEVGCLKAFLTPSCTAALEMSALLLDLQPGDEVILPSFTFVSTACAFAIFGVRPVFVDVTADTLNLDHTQLMAALTPNTRAIVPVHYAGVACEMDAINAFAQEHDLRVVEDNAHGLTGRYRGRPLGSLGDMATVSFHETKNFSCGEGGALMVNAPAYLERADIVQEKGTNRSRFLMGMTDKYTWVDRGSSYLLGEFPAALLLANLEDRQTIQTRRLSIWNRYQSELSAWSQSLGVKQPTIPTHCDHPAHLYFLLMPDVDARQRLMQYLREKGIQAAYHYQPLHTSPMGQQFGAEPDQCPVSQQVAAGLIRLPLYAGMSDEQQERVLAAVQQWRG